MQNADNVVAPAIIGECADGRPLWICSKDDTLIAKLLSSAEVVLEFQAEFQGFGPDHVGARHCLGTYDDSALGPAVCS